VAANKTLLSKNQSATIRHPRFSNDFAQMTDRCSFALQKNLNPEGTPES
jgi:hypothetical protein